MVIDGEYIFRLHPLLEILSLSALQLQFTQSLVRMRSFIPIALLLSKLAVAAPADLNADVKELGM